MYHVRGHQEKYNLKRIERDLSEKLSFGHCMCTALGCVWVCVMVVHNIVTTHMIGMR